MTKIYTRKGDDGTTSLWYGGRVSKASLRTEAYGCVDETVSVLGVARALCEDPELGSEILLLQQELFVLGAELATAPEARERLEVGVSSVDSSMVERLEARIDRFMAEVDLPPKFVIPGGTSISASLDVARSKLRTAERRVVDLSEAELVGPALLGYINRANDLLFALARWSDEPVPEVFEGRGK